MNSAQLASAIATIGKLTSARRLEYGNPQIPPIENPLGEGYTGVDLDGRTYRARIGVCAAFDGSFKRITLGRSYSAEYAAFLYRVAHVALYGRDSWAACSFSEGEQAEIRQMRGAALAG